MSHRLLIFLFYSLLIFYNFTFYVADVVIGNLNYPALRVCVLLASITLGFVPVVAFCFVTGAESKPYHKLFLLVGSIVPFLISLSFNDLVRHSINTILELTVSPDTSIDTPGSWATNSAILICILICAVGEEVSKLLAVLLFIIRPASSTQAETINHSFVSIPAVTAKDYMNAGVFAGFGFAISENFWYFANEMRTEPYILTQAVFVGVTRSLGSMHAMLTGYAASSVLLKTTECGGLPDKSTLDGYITLSIFVRSLVVPSLFHFALNVTALLLQKISANIIAIRGLQAAIWIGFVLIFYGMYRRASGVFM